MKLLKFFVLLIFTLKSHSSFSQEINFKFDLDNAKETIALLKTKDPTDAQIKAFVNLPGTQALIKKIKANDALAYQAIKDASQGIFKNETQDFQYQSIAKNLDKWDNFIELVLSKEDSIKEDLRKSFALYLDKSKTYNFNVFMLMGGYSAGFAFGDNSNSFYIVLHHYQFDAGAVAVVCKHELFHNIQAIYYSPDSANEKLNKLNKGYANAHTLLNYLFMEGTASYIEDYDAIKSKKMPYLKEMRDHVGVNEYRIGSLNLLVNTMLLEVFRKPKTVGLGEAYELLFDWNWNNPAYFIGEKMTEALLESKGTEALKDYMRKDAVYFFEDYIRLAKTDQEKYPIQFTPEFEKMVVQVRKRIEKIN